MIVRGDFRVSYTILKFSRDENVTIGQSQPLTKFKLVDPQKFCCDSFRLFSHLTSLT